MVRDTNQNGTDDDYELRGTYDRHAYDAIRDGFEDGDRVTLVYESPYSGTEVEVEGTARDVFAVSFTLDLDDGREWGVMGESVRTTKASRRASGRVDAKNGRTVGGVRELRVYAVEDEDADEEAAEVRADGGEDADEDDDLPTHTTVEEFAAEVDLSEFSDDELDALDDRVTELLNTDDPYDFPSDEALSAAFSLDRDIRDEKQDRDPARDDPHYRPGDTADRFDLPVRRVVVEETDDNRDAVRVEFTFDVTPVHESPLPLDEDEDEDEDADPDPSDTWSFVLTGEEDRDHISTAVLHYYGVEDPRALGVAVGETFPVVGSSEGYGWGRVDRFALLNGYSVPEKRTLQTYAKTLSSLLDESNASYVGAELVPELRERGEEELADYAESFVRRSDSPDPYVREFYEWVRTRAMEPPLSAVPEPEPELRTDGGQDLDLETRVRDALDDVEEPAGYSDLPNLQISTHDEEGNVVVRALEKRRRPRNVHRNQLNALDEAGLTWTYKDDARFSDGRNPRVVVVTGVEDEDPDENPASLERVIPLSETDRTRLDADNEAITFEFDYAASVTLVHERNRRKWEEHDRPEDAGDVFFLDRDDLHRVKYSQTGFLLDESNVRVIREASADIDRDDDDSPKVRTDGGQDLDEHPDRRLADSTGYCGEPTLVGGDLVECELRPGHTGNHAGHVPDEETPGLLWDVHEWTDPDSEDEDEDTETSGTPIRTDGGREANSVRCPECGEQGFDGQGYAVVEGTRMYLRNCWECGTRFAVEDSAEFRPDGGTVEDDEEEDPTPNTLRVSRTELADGTVRGELAASKTVQGATVSVEATGDMDLVERATKEWLQVVAAVEETLSDDPSGPESFGLFFDDSTENENVDENEEGEGSESAGIISEEDDA